MATDVCTKHQQADPCIECLKKVMGDEIRALRTRVDSLKHAAAQSRMLVMLQDPNGQVLKAYSIPTRLLDISGKSFVDASGLAFSVGNQYLRVVELEQVSGMRELKKRIEDVIKEEVTL